MRLGTPVIHFLTLLAIMTPLAGVSAAIVWAMVKRGPIDRPNARSSHTNPVPKGGGLGPACVFLAVMGLSAWYHPHSPTLPGLLGGALIIGIMALLDDLYNLPFTIKLAAQSAAALVAIASGLQVSSIGDVPLGVLGPVATFCWILYVTNAVNFMDGLNGLAAGTCAIAAFALALAPGSASEEAGLVLAGGLLGFLPFNYPRARIFLGDIGSQFCGFTLAVLAVSELQQDTPGVWVVPLTLLVLLFDVGVTLVRRLLARERVTDAHRGHCYQLLHRTGVPAVWISAGVWAMAGWGAGWAIGGPWWAAVPAALAPPVAWTVWAWKRARARLETW